MSAFVERLIAVATEQWRRFGGSTRAIDDRWHVVGEEFDDPYCGYVGEYWAAVDRPEWDGRVDQPWSAAFISWCFEAAGAGAAFPKSDTHSEYVDAIRRTRKERFRLLDPATATIAPGDLIWNARVAQGSSLPKNHAEAIAALDKRDFFASHVDIVSAVRPGQCDSIGGNVSNRDPGGSVTRSTWALDADGRLTDARKLWIGVVKIDL